jgi:SAM-dependent methyltransferase
MTPILGHSRSDECGRTRDVYVGAIRESCRLEGRRLLDLGCGDGTFTIPLGETFEEVYGVDVQPANIERFARRAPSRKYRPLLMSAAALEFPDGHFDRIVSLEAFEHIDDMRRAAAECWRVLRPGGEFVVTAPNRWFPCENHGGRLLGREFGRLPLLTYLPPLHARFANARVFTVRGLDALFEGAGFRRIHVRWLWPTFEHGGNPLQRYLRPLFPVMRTMERSPLKFLGTSILAVYRKPAAN